MTNDQINIAIAEVCGWDMDPEEAHEWESRGRWVKSPRGQMKFRHAIPDYCNDLNAMREAEQKLWSMNWELRYEFIYQLTEVVKPIHGYRMLPGIGLLDVTARERAEALLKTIGKWEESE